MDFATIVTSLHEELELVEQRLRRAAQVEFPLVGEFLEAIIEAGGKRLRPILLILSSKSFSYDLESLIPAAAGVEMLHTASLVHDDTIDSAVLRRGQPTLNSAFPTETVILLGDYLFAQSAILATETMNPRVVAVFAASLADICDGQLREIFNSGRLDQSGGDYERRIYGKTASLFAGAAEMGAIIGQAGQDQIENLKHFGTEVGMAFQIVDDVLDIRSTTERIGKPAGLDIRQGTLTLPTMLYLRGANGSPTAATLQRIFDGEDVPEDEFGGVVQAINASGAVDEALERASTYVERAKNRLEKLPDPYVAEQLAAFADLTLERTT